MINQYSVKFKDSHFEQLYQAHMFNEYRYPLCLALTSGIIVISAIGIIEGILLADIPFIILKSISIMFAVPIILIVRKWHNLMRPFIFLAIMYSILYQLSLDPNQDSNYGYLVGSNMMVFSLTLLLLSDFIDGAISNMILLTFRVFITAKYTSSTNTQVYQFSSFLFIVLMVGLYKYNRSKRIEFLLSHKDSQWERVLPTMIQSPFLLFSYNQELVRFQMSMTNLEGEPMQILKKVLRENTYSGVTLESFIYKRIINGDKSDKTVNMVIYNKKRPINITYSEFRLVDQNILIVFPSEQITKLEQQISQVSKRHVLQSLKYMHHLHKTLFLSIRMKNWKIITQLYSNLMHKENRIICEYGEYFYAEFVNVTTIIKRMNQIYKDKFISDQIEPIIIYSFKPFIQLLINLINTASYQHSKIKLKYDQPCLKITAWLDKTTLQSNQLFNKACRILCSQVQSNANGYNFIIEEQPNLAYTQRNIELNFN